MVLKEGYPVNIFIHNNTKNKFNFILAILHIEKHSHRIQQQFFIPLLILSTTNYLYNPEGVKVGADEGIATPRK